MIKLNSENFIEKLIEAFPEIKDEVLDEDNLGLSSLQISWFRRSTQIAIDSNSEKPILNALSL